MPNDSLKHDAVRMGSRRSVHQARPRRAALPDGAAEPSPAKIQNQCECGCLFTVGLMYLFEITPLPWNAVAMNMCCPTNTGQETNKRDTDRGNASPRTLDLKSQAAGENSSHHPRSRPKFWTIQSCIELHRVASRVASMQL